MTLSRSVQQEDRRTTHVDMLPTELQIPHSSGSLKQLAEELHQSSAKMSRFQVHNQHLGLLHIYINDEIIKISAQR